uniref:LAGLIDADG endonuclease n=1 Tax=Fusarium denticulatum TaxID=48507 RepID=A0A6M4B0F0_9HYPO|nr:LAGLIDADG endonuclease [Fusarium denticulatum]
MPFFNKINLIYNKSIRSFYFFKTYSTIFINNYTTRRSFSMLIYSFSLLIYSFSMLERSPAIEKIYFFYKAYFVWRSRKICAASSTSSIKICAPSSSSLRKSFSLRGYSPRESRKLEKNVFFSSLRSPNEVSCPLENDKNKPIGPWFITGFTDAEGSFMVHLEKNQWRVRPRFQIKLDIRDLSLLKEIKAYFNHIGSINISNKECVYKVRSLNEVAIIISHFDKYNLMSQKRADFDLFKQIVNKLNNQEHLTSEGLQEIVDIGVSMNLDSSSLVKDNFPNTRPVARPLVKDIVIPHPEWIAGFVSGKGSFSIYASQSVDKSVSLSFRVFQYELGGAKDDELFKFLGYFFNCGNLNYHEDKKAVIFVIRKFEDINHKIIPFFDKYKIKGVKYKDFKDWSEAAKIIESKNHLTQEGHNEIRRIRKNMNSYRL